MSYQKNNNQKTNSGSSSVSEAVALRKGLSFPAVPALQRQGAEEELQMKKIPAQLMEEEEPLQGKFETIQKVEEEEPLQGKFETIQKVEEEEPLQGKFETVQRVEEEEPLQGKFETVQRVEEEEPLQGKFETIQRVEQEEPLQGKFETIQRVEEEEPLQGKFETIQKVEEEEPLQGKFETVQKVEEEEPLQGKFETVQKVEEEEPLQGKFETVQRVEEEEPLQGKFETIQKVEEEEPLQGKFETVQRLEEEEPLQGKFETIQKVEVPKNTNQNGLPGNLKSGIEQLSGYSMDDVKVHYNSSQPAQLQALAYAQGTDIHIAPGQEKHLPHEAWHVAQQKQGRVQPTLQMKTGVPVNDDAGLENEADVMGAKALQNGNQLSTPLQRMIADKTKSNSGGIIQRAIGKVPERYTPLEKAMPQNPPAPITTTSKENTDSAAAKVEPSVVEETSGSAGDKAIKKADAPGRKRRDAVSETRKPALGKNGKHITDMDNMLPNWIEDEDFDDRTGASQGISAGNEAIEEEKNPQQAEIFITEAKSKKWTKEVTKNGLKDMGFTSDVIKVFFQEFWGDDDNELRKRRHAVTENSLARADHSGASKGINGMWASSKTISQNAALWEKLETKEETNSNILKKYGKESAEIFGGANSVGKNSQGGSTAEDLTDAYNIAGNAGKAIVSGNTADIANGIGSSKKLLDDKLPMDETEKLIGEWLSTAGSSMRTVINAVRGISEISEKTGSAKGKIEISADLLKLIQDGAKTAISIMDQINTVVPTALASLVPGLGVAIDACKLVIDMAKYYESNQVVKQLGPEEEEEKSQLNNLLNTKNVAETIPGIFHLEERGVALHKQKYVRLKPGIMSELQDIDNAFHNELNHAPLPFRTWCRKYGIYEQLKDISYQEFYDAVVAYELVSKLMEINQKRGAVAKNGLTIGTISMAANIMKLIPVDGGITAATLTAAAAIGTASLKGGKWIQTKSRNEGKFGGDQTRSEDNKHKEYVQLVRNLYKLLSDVSDLSETDELEKIELFIGATGANLNKVYALNGEEDQVKLLIQSMKEGR